MPRAQAQARGGREEVGLGVLDLGEQAEAGEQGEDGGAAVAVGEV